MIFGLVGRIYLFSIACAALVVGSCAVVLMPPLPPPRFSFVDMFVRLAAHDYSVALADARRAGAPPVARCASTRAATLPS